MGRPTPRATARLPTIAPAALVVTLPVTLHTALLVAGLILLTPISIGAQDSTAAQAATPDELAALDNCDARVRTAPLDPQSYYCFLLAVRGGTPAADAVRRLDAILARDPDAPGRHRARMILGMIENGRGNPRAEALLSDAVDGMEATGDDYGVVYGGLALAYRLGEKGRLEEADAVVERAARAAEATGDPEMQANVWTEQGMMAMRRADYGRSLYLYRKAEQAIFPDGPAWLQGNVLNGIGWLQWYFGNLRQAMATYHREGEIRQASGNRYGEVTPRVNRAFLAMALADRGEYPREACVPLVDEALEVSVASDRATSEAHARLLHARLLPGEQAVAELERAIRLAERVGDVALRWSAMGLLADRKLDLGPEHEGEAFALLDATVEEARQAGMPTELGYALQRRADLVTRARPRDEAIAAWDACLDVVETIGKLQAEDTTRAYTLSHWSFPYHRLVDLLLNGLDASSDPDADLDKAFLTMERRHARSLVEILGDRGVREETDRFPTLAEVRAALQEDEAMLLWEVVPATTGRSWLMAVRRDGVQVRKLPGREDLEDAVTMFEALVRADDPLLARAAADLYSILVGDALDGMADRLHTVFLIPDGSLHRLSFAALRKRQNADPIGTSLRVDIVPSAALWIGWRTMPPDGGPTAALAMADPEITTATTLGLYRQTDAAQSTAAQTDAAQPDSADGGWRPGRLAYARDEARTVARAVGGSSRVLVGAAASEGALKAIDPADYRVIHFATHAVVDDARPERSAVLLAPGGGKSAEDGLLQVGEIAALDLRDHVVILSACRGASGPVVGGEGVLGLARAFLTAGARTVLANRWPYRDDEAAALTKAMAREIARGRSVGDALTAARRSRAAAGAPMAAWAGVTLIGDGGVVPVPDGGALRNSARIGFALLLVLILAWFVWRVARRRLGGPPL